MKPQNQSAMTSFADNYGEHVYYEGTDQHIHQLYWQSGPSWADQDLTLISGSSVTPQNQSPLTSFVDSFGEHALYVGTNQHVVQLFWTHSGGWVEQDLNAIAENGLLTPPAVGSPLISFWNSYGEHVYYLAQPEGSEDDILELCFCGGGIWTLEDPTQHATGGPQHQAVIGSRTTGATQVSSTVGDVFYLSIRTPGQQYIDIYDISGNSSGSTSWQIVDLNSLTSAPETAASVGYTNEALTSFVDPY